MIPLDKAAIQFFMTQPESGMGYHIVKIIMQNGDVHDGIVYNCEFLRSKVPIKKRKIKDIILA